MPISDEKTEWSSTQIVFLGLLLDGEHHLILIPQEKIDKASNYLNLMLAWKKAKVKELQGLAGLLNFMTRDIYPGRAFTRRMYAKFAGQLETMKNYHHICLDSEFKVDCRV